MVKYQFARESVLKDSRHVNLFTFVKEVILFFFLPSRTRNDRKTSISISTKGARTVRIYVVMTQLRSRKVQGHPEENVHHFSYTCWINFVLLFFQHTPFLSTRSCFRNIRYVWSWKLKKYEFRCVKFSRCDKSHERASFRMWALDSRNRVTIRNNFGAIIPGGKVPVRGAIFKDRKLLLGIIVV